MIMEILMMMMTVKLKELNKFLTLLVVRRFVSLFSGSPNEPLCFVKGTEKGAPVKIIQIHMAISYLLVKDF